MARRLSIEAARRVAVAAQGLGDPPPVKVGPAALRRTIRRLGVLQIDSVNVFERSHYLPLLARLGPYDKSTLDRMLHHDTGTGLGEYTEYVAHEAAVLPVADWALWAWHRDGSMRESFRQWGRDNAALIAEVRSEFDARGVARVRDLDHPANVSRGGGWWNKNDVHWAAHWLFRRGDLMVVGRERFERRFSLAARVLPSGAEAPIPRADAILELVRRASRAYGVATLDDLADYPRLRLDSARAAVDELVEQGELEPVTVDGWGRQAYLASGVRVPRRVEGAALLSPFDPLIWHRPRAERLFGFRYRISIYTPAAQREHGYYVLPVLVDGEIVGRIDLKSDRAAGVLRVQHAHIEPASEGRRTELAVRIAPVLHRVAAWQGLTDVSLTGPGTWAADLGAAL